MIFILIFLHFSNYCNTHFLWHSLLYYCCVKTKYKNREVNSFAYRNGYGGVTLAIATDHQEHTWDFVLKDPGDTSWYDKLAAETLSQSTLYDLCFRPLYPKNKKHTISPELRQLLIESPITPITTVQRIPAELNILTVWNCSEYNRNILIE